MAEPESKEQAARVLVNPDSLPVPRGFNHGILVAGGQLLFLAGQDASGPDGSIKAPGDVVAQCDQVLANLREVVGAAGGGMPDIVKINIYVTDRNAYKAQLGPLGQVFRRYFGAYYPATALFEVKSLFQDDALIEIEGIAVLYPAIPAGEEG
jgi:enamine deaminase RidA (YjgF/YER057c/UK114 family)